MSNGSILIGPSSFAERDRSPLERMLSSGYRVVDNPYKRKLERTELLELLTDDVIGIVAGLEPLDAGVLEKSKLKVVSRVGSGMSNVDLKAARDLGIAVYSTPSGPTQAVAELTLGGLLSVMRLIPEMDADLHGGKWSKRIGVQLQGKTVAIVGYGRIGRRFAELLAPFNVRLIAVDPILSADAAANAELMSLMEALPLADVVSLHSSGEEQMIGAAEIARMKKGAILLNPARGGLVDDAALAQALQERHLAGAWIDTFSKEPYAGPLTSCRNAVLTPHVGSYTEECRLSMETEAVENLLKGLSEAAR